VKTCSEKPSSEWGGGAHEQDNTGACQEHANTRWIAQAVLNRCSQYNDVSDQQRIIGTPEL